MSKAKLAVMNLTAHPVRVYRNDVCIATFPPAGIVARCQEERQLRAVYNGVPITSFAYGDVYGLLEERPGTVYIVSHHIMAARPDRPDILAPYGKVRDKQGNIIGCTGFKCTAAFDARRIQGATS